MCGLSTARINPCKNHERSIARTGDYRRESAAEFQAHVSRKLQPRTILKGYTVNLVKGRLAQW